MRAHSALVLLGMCMVGTHGNYYSSPHSSGESYWPDYTGNHNSQPSFYQREGLPHRYHGEEDDPLDQTRRARPRAKAGTRVGRRRPGPRAASRSREAAGLNEEEYDEEEEEELVDEEHDAVEEYWSKFSGRLMVTGSSGIVGGLLGMAFSTSVMGQPDTTVFIGFLLALVVCQFNNDFGALFRALGLMLILFVRRAILARSTIPLWPQVFSALRLRSRQPFPPSENPWSYRRTSNDDVDFDMTRSLISVCLSGCFVGWSLGNMIGLFILPPWILALAIGGFLTYCATCHNPNGDLSRVMGMKVWTLISLLRGLDQELHVASKLGRVFNISAAGMARFDKQYKVRDKIGFLASWVYGRFNRAAGQVQQDMSQAGYEKVFPSAPFAPEYDETPEYSNRGRRERPSSYHYERPPPYNPEYTGSRR